MTISTRLLPTGETLAVDLDDSGAVIGRECRDDGLVHPLAALAAHGRGTRYLCRACHAARLAVRDGSRSGS